MSLASLRRWRVLSALLLVASPGAGGSVLPLLHPCPVDSPWLIHAPAAGHHAGHHGGMGGAPQAQHHDQACHCVGSCLVIAALTPRSHGFQQVVLRPPSTVGWIGHDATLVLASRASLLPPATAPPLG